MNNLFSNKVIPTDGTRIILRFGRAEVGFLFRATNAFRSLTICTMRKQAIVFAPNEEK